MATPRYKGAISAEIREQVQEDLAGFDQITREIRAQRVHLESLFRGYQHGSKHPNHPSMVLWSKQKTDAGNYGEITIEYRGIIHTKVDPFVSETRPRLLQQVTLKDEANVSVSVNYYATSYSVVWMHRGSNEPRSPKFQSKAPVGGTPDFRDPSPPSYTGNLAYKTRVKLEEFTPRWVAPYVWEVSERWARIVQPVDDPNDNSSSQGNEGGESAGADPGE